VCGLALAGLSAAVNLAFAARAAYLIDMSSLINPSGYFAGQMLIAMPQMRDTRFARSVVYLCAHTAEGAMGLVVNRLFNSLSFGELLEQLSIEASVQCANVRIHFGGPVEAGRGFVLHSTDYLQETTLMVNDEVGLTATIDVLKALADGRGPERYLLALGYAGWAAGQLDSEIRENAWLSVQSDAELLFDHDIDSKWQRAISKIGVDFNKLSAIAGHA
jgi:putative transcriptional regulator